MCVLQAASTSPHWSADKPFKLIYSLHCKVFSVSVAVFQQCWSADPLPLQHQNVRPTVLSCFTIHHHLLHPGHCLSESVKFMGKATSSLHSCEQFMVKPFIIQAVGHSSNNDIKARSWRRQQYFHTVLVSRLLPCHIQMCASVINDDSFLLQGQCSSWVVSVLWSALHFSTITKVSWHNSKDFQDCLLFPATFLKTCSFHQQRVRHWCALETFFTALQQDLVKMFYFPM